MADAARADTVVVHTREARRHHEPASGGPGTSVEVIHHGDYAFFATAGRPTGRPPDGPWDLPERGQLLLAFGAIRSLRSACST